ncbi:hypothetical protein [Nocardioides stalactiti]|uniref:hypothetical protein n=1 Tax=Nocardioides stalactiti TaxID=2755356 RepID=UPI0015FEBE8C|nr:hypothetical protein [Nocardioides stalactiti]
MADIDLHVELRVDEVLAGRVGDGTNSITLILGPYDTSEISAKPWTDLLGLQAVFTLRRAGTAVTNDWGSTREDPALLAKNLYFVINSKGLLERGPDGLTRSPWAEKSGWTPKIERRPFEDVLASIRAADD